MIARITLELTIPPGVTESEAKEWLRFRLGDNGIMSGDNPLVDREFEPGTFDVQFYGLTQAERERAGQQRLV
jgi:hypothetical protein